MKQINHEVFGTFELKDPLTHGNIEDYSEAIIAMQTAEHGIPYNERATIESAATAGILITEVNIKEAPPAMPTWLAAEIVLHIQAARQLPKN